DDLAGETCSLPKPSTIAATSAMASSRLGMRVCTVPIRRPPTRADPLYMRRERPRRWRPSDSPNEIAPSHFAFPKGSGDAKSACNFPDQTTKSRPVKWECDAQFAMQNYEPSMSQTGLGRVKTPATVTRVEY